MRAGRGEQGGGGRGRSTQDQRGDDPAWRPENQGARPALPLRARAARSGFRRDSRAGSGPAHARPAVRGRAGTRM